MSPRLWPAIRDCLKHYMFAKISIASHVRAVNKQTGAHVARVRLLPGHALFVLRNYAIGSVVYPITPFLRPFWMSEQPPFFTTFCNLVAGWRTVPCTLR